MNSFILYVFHLLITIQYNPTYRIVVSVDKKGDIEYWDPETRDLPEHDVEFMMKPKELYDFKVSRYLLLFKCIYGKLKLLFIYFLFLLLF